MSRHFDPLQRILSAYPPGLALLTALDTYIQTCEEGARARGRDDVAQSVCEGLHVGPPHGLKCAACYQAEMNVPYQMQVEAEIEAAREKKT